MKIKQIPKIKINSKRKDHGNRKENEITNAHRKENENGNRIESKNSKKKENRNRTDNESEENLKRENNIFTKLITLSSANLWRETTFNKLNATGLR
jgi:hypothetical protein